jgi:hypothetical protein
VKKWIIGGVLFGTLGVGLALVKPDKSPKAELRVVGRVMWEGMDLYELELTNRTPHDLQFLGFEPSDPRCEYLYWEGGEWKEPPGYRCGFGLGPQTLASGGSIRFTSGRPLDTPCRYGVFLRGREYTSGKVHKLEWLPEWLRTKAVTWQEDRLHKQWLEAVTWTSSLAPVPHTAAELMAREALEAGVVMDWENLMEKDPYAAGPPNFDPRTDPFAPAPGGMVPAPAGADPFAPSPYASKSL